MYALYSDALAAGWQSSTWGATANLASTSYVHTGTFAVSYAVTSAYGAFAPALSTGSLGTTPYTNVRFWINGEATGGQQLAFMVRYTSTMTWGPLIRINPYLAGGSVVAGQWRLVDLPLSALSASNTLINRIAIQDMSGTTQPGVSVDDIEFYSVSPLTSTPSNTATASPTGTDTPTATWTPSSTTTPTPSATPSS